MNNTPDCPSADGLLPLSLLVFVTLMPGHVLAQQGTPAEKPVIIPEFKAVDEIRLGMPIDCIVGKDCHILAYMDHRPGPEFQDFACGHQTYDGHDGTDFGLADEAAMKKGVAVKASAAGTIVRVRDGVRDKRVENSQEASDVTNYGCGNAVVIDHPAHWRTYYCHLRNGSLTVKPGMRVEKGSLLGMVGSSGLASYPHVHFGVYHRGEKIDPFHWTRQGKGCHMEIRALWVDPIAYTPTGLINAGFSDQKPEINAVWQGASSLASLTTLAASIIFWVHPFGVIAGDFEQFRLISPNGKTVVESNTLIKSSNRINQVSFVGKRNTPEAPIGVGIWRGEYQLRRNGKLLIDIFREIEAE